MIRIDGTTVRQMAEGESNYFDLDLIMHWVESCEIWVMARHDTMSVFISGDIEVLELSQFFAVFSILPKVGYRWNKPEVRSVDMDMLIIARIMPEVEVVANGEAIIV